MAAGKRQRASESGKLAHLIDAEERLADALRRARDRAAAIVAEAERQVAEEGVALEQELERATEELDAQLDARLEAEIDEIGRQAAREADWYDAQPEARIGDLAAVLLQRLVEGGP